MSGPAKRQVRVLQIQTQAEAAGAQRISQLIAAGLRDRGYDVRTVFMYRKTAAFDDDAHAIFVSKTEPRSALSRLQTAVRLIRFVKSDKPDVVITYQHYGNIVGALAARVAAAPTVIANQSGNPGKRGLRRLLSWVDHLYGRFGFYDSIVVNSASTEVAYRTLSPRYSRKLVRIDHGVPGPGVLPDKRSARDRFGLPRNIALLVTTGRLAPGKNLDMLIRALQLLPDVHLALAGAGPDRVPLERLSTSLNVEDRVHFVGELDGSDIPAFLAAGDIFVFASDDETFGMSVVEAAIAGLPVVTTDIPVLREVLTNDLGEASALFVPVNDHAALAAAVLHFWTAPELAEKLRSTGQSLAERYSVERMIEAYDDLIRHRTAA
jgi:glycosyltransferase involved in cell wall biosynthesis